MTNMQRSPRALTHDANDEFFQASVELMAATHVATRTGVSTNHAGRLCDWGHLAGAVEVDGLLTAAAPTAAVVSTWTAGSEHVHEAPARLREAFFTGP